jgi:dTDP-4-amino-4,6-dideoxygalactose transaminase
VRQYYVGRPNLTDRDRFMQRVATILDSRHYTNHGPFCRELEALAQKVVPARHVLAVNNATIGLELVIEAMDWTPGEVLVPSFTFAASAHAIVRAGHKPVFVEINDDYCIDVEDARRKITPQTRGILACDLFGNLADRRGLAALGLPVIFDSAHALGCGGMAGSGICQVFSLHATKLINSFEGGLIATEITELADRISLLRNNGFINGGPREGRVDIVGTNAKLSEIHAAMGLTCLEDAGEIIGRNRQNFEQYSRHLPPEVRVLRPNHAGSNFSYLVTRVDAKMREPLIDALTKIGVNARSYFQPVHSMPAYKRSGVSLPRTEAISASVVALPQGFAVDEPVIAEIGRCMDQTLAAKRSSVPTSGGRPPRHVRTARKGARAVA